jgi:hypothetical protein
LRRYAEEGVRRDEHPMITFRDGPTGRRAGVIGRPDIWEIAMWIDDLEPVRDPAAQLAADGVVSRAQIDAALAYRAAYPDEIQGVRDAHRERWRLRTHRCRAQQRRRPPPRRADRALEPLLSPTQRP